MTIIRNSAKCAHCGKEIESAHRRASGMVSSDKMMYWYERAMRAEAMLTKLTKLCPCRCRWGVDSAPGTL